MLISFSVFNVVRQIAKSITNNAYLLGFDMGSRIAHPMRKESSLSPPVWIVLAFLFPNCAPASRSG